MKERACDVLITYCWNRVGYNILRSLSARGLHVWVADTSRHNICSMSRFAAGSFVYPDPFTHETEFLTCLREHISSLSPKVLLPTHDEALVIAAHREQFPSDLVILTERIDLLQRLSNKKEATALAASLGIPVPKVYGSPLQATFPCVFKTVVGNSAKTVFYPNNAKELEQLCQAFSAEETLTEELCPGTDYSVDCVRQGSRFFSSVYRALETKTPRGGTTTQREIVDCPLLQGYAKRLLDAVDYNGVCGIDFKYDETQKRAAFLEINARYTGGLATPLAAGFDIPYLHYCLALGLPLPAETTARVGVRTKWILGDFIALVGRLLSRDISRQSVRPLLRFDFDRFDDFRRDDKRVILGEASYYLSKLLKNGKLNP